MDGPLTEFNEDDWYSLVDYATVYSGEDIRFTFKNEMEVNAWKCKSPGAGKKHGNGGFCLVELEFAWLLNFIFSTIL